VMAPDTAKSSATRPPAITGPPTMRNAPCSVPSAGSDAGRSAVGRGVCVVGGEESLPPALHAPSSDARTTIHANRFISTPTVQTIPGFHRGDGSAHPPQCPLLADDDAV
jgi:hypothetical protein